MKAITRIGFGSLVLSLALVACPTPVQPPTPPGPPAPPPPPPPATVSKVVIEQPSLLLEKPGATAKLVAQALDARGNPVTASVSFQSLRPGVITLDQDGVVTGVKVGSSQVVAVANGVRSAPIIVAVADLQEGVTNITEDKVVSGPSFAPTGKPITVGTRYTVVVQGVAPTPGKLWFSQGKGKRLSGKVVALESLGNQQTRVTLEVVPFRQIFKKIQIDEELDLGQLQDTISPKMLELYHVKQEANGVWQFTPKNPNATAPIRVGQAGSVRPQVFVDFGPIECELTNISGQLPLSLNIPSMTIGFTPDRDRTRILVDIDFFSPNFIEMRFAATVNATMTMSGQLTRDFSGGVNCRVDEPITSTIADIPLPLEPLTSLRTKRGLGLELQGSFSGPTTNFTVQGNVSVSFSLGARLNLDNLTVTRFNTLTPTANGVVGFANTGPTISRLNLSAGAYVFDNWVLGTPGIPGIGSFDIWENKNGVKLSADLASVRDQIVDANYRSSYSLSRYGRNGPGREFEDFLDFFNARELFPPTRTYSDPIDDAFTLQTFGCSRFGTTERALCVTRFSDSTFPVVGNNIDKIEIHRRRVNLTPGGGTQVISSLLATDTDNSGIITTATPAEVPLTALDTCVLVVYTKLMPTFGLEAGSTSCLN
jgi:hypothetical protein